MPETPDWSDRYDAELANAMLGGALRAPEGSVGGLPEYLGIRFTEVGPGRCVGELDVGENLLNPFGAAHGGVLATFTDHIMGAAVFPLIPRGTWPATLEFKLNYLAPTRPGVLQATARVISLSKRTAVIAVDCENHGRPVATALGTLALTPPKPAAG